MAISMVTITAIMEGTEAMATMAQTKIVKMRMGGGNTLI